VVGRPRGSQRFLKLNFGLVGRTWLNYRSGGGFGEKWRPSVQKVEEWYVKSQHLQGCRPHLCRLRNDGLVPCKQVLNIPIACHRYGPGKPSSQLSIKAWLFPTASMVIVGAKLGTDPWINQPLCYELCREPFFSGAVNLFKSVDDYMKGCYMWTAWDTYGRGPYVDREWKACGVLVGFSLAWCTSIRITVTLGYEYLLFVAVIT
jgi:hypothetical protein